MRFAILFLTVPLFLFGCMESTSPTRSSTGISFSGSAIALDGTYILGPCSSRNDAAGGLLDCRRSIITIADGVGQGRKYGTDFDNGGFKVIREYSRIEFSDIVNGAVTIRSTYYDNIYNEQRTVVSQGTVGLSRGVVAGLRWNENVEGRAPTTERWDRLGPTGLTLFDEEIEALEAQIRSNNARRQQQRQNFDNGVATLTGVAAGLSGQQLPQSTPSSDNLWCENKTCDTPGCENYGGCKLR